MSVHERVQSLFRTVVRGSALLAIGTIAPVRAAGVSVTNYGHSALLIRGGGQSVMVNPFRAVGCAKGLAEPRVNATVTLASSELPDEGGSLGDSVGTFNFKAITDRFSELMYDYPFRVPARFALIIRAVVSQEGLALRLDPDFKIIAVAYPYVAKRLLAGDTKEMREKLLEVLFDSEGHLRLERLESLLDVVGSDAPTPGAELIPVAGAGLRLLLSKDGADLRRRMLLTLVRDDRLSTEDLRSLTSLLGRTFSPRRIAGRMLQQLNPLAAA